MKIQTKQNTEGAEILALDGELDFHATTEVRDAISKLTDRQTPKVLIDFAGVGYIDSSGLAIFVEAFMSFIGIGIAPPMASLGTMCNDAMEALRSNPYQLFLPALAICLIMFAFNFVGDGLRDALDPKLKK